MERGAQGLLINEVQLWRRVRVGKTPSTGELVRGKPPDSTEVEDDMRKPYIIIISSESYVCACVVD